MKNIIITGASSGVGAAVAKELARKGYSVGLVVRNPVKGKQVKDQIVAETGNHKIKIFIGDLSKQKDVRAVADQIKSEYPVIDVLINNAGLNPTEHKITEDGYEYAWATNHLAYFLLTNLLLDTIMKSNDGRIINTASMAESFGKIHWDDINFQNKKFSALKVYSQSKLANLMFSYHLADMVEFDNIKVNAIHPGLVSSGFGKGGKTFIDWMMHKVALVFGRSPERAADTYIWLLTDPEARNLTRGFYFDRKLQKNNKIADDKESLERLWQLNLKQTKLLSVNSYQ